MFALIQTILTLTLGSLFQVFVNFFLKFVTKRVALSGAAIAIFLTFTAVFIAAIKALIANLAVAVPNEMTLAISWFMPTNADDCIAAYFAAHTARFIYDMKTRIIQYSLF